ncbi:hypothetical protein HDV04_001191 [Boothiomyces sp. JEL0838]|nr:hypothetical protein HDV04_001191 [Boothiomyces sp. JEL0838]
MTFKLTEINPDTLRGPPKLLPKYRDHTTKDPSINEIKNMNDMLLMKTALPNSPMTKNITVWKILSLKPNNILKPTKEKWNFEGWTSGVEEAGKQHSNELCVTLLLAATSDVGVIHYEMIEKRSGAGRLTKEMVDGWQAAERQNH